MTSGPVHDLSTGGVQKRSSFLTPICGKTDDLMEKSKQPFEWCHLADSTGFMTSSSVVFLGRFMPLNGCCGEISLIDPICAFEVSTY